MAGSGRDYAAKVRQLQSPQQYLLPKRQPTFGIEGLRAFGSAPLDTVTDARSSRLVVGLLKHLDFTGAADKAANLANLVGCKSPHHQLPGRVVSMSDACGGNEACSART